MHVWSALGAVANMRCRFDETVRAHEQVSRHAVLSGQQVSFFRASFALVLGSRPADEALEALATGGAAAHPKTLLAQAWLLARLGRFDEARRLATDVAPRYREIVGNPNDVVVRARIESLARGLRRAIALQREHCRFLEQNSALASLSTGLPLIGRWLCLLGRHDEAEPLARRGRELTPMGDVVSEAGWRQAQALVDAHRGNHARAEQLAREALALREETDSPTMQGDALYDLAEVLAAAGRTDEAAAALVDARGRYERKRCVAMVTRVQARLDALAPAPA